MTVLYEPISGLHHLQCVRVYNTGVRLITLEDQVKLTASSPIVVTLPQCDDSVYRKKVSQHSMDTSKVHKQGAALSPLDTVIDS